MKIEPEYAPDFQSGGPIAFDTCFHVFKSYEIACPTQYNHNPLFIV